MARIKIGDVVEVQTSKGLAYAHFTHKHAEYGNLLRVFRRFFEVRPTDFQGLVNSEPAFVCFFPLAAAINLKIVEIAGNAPIPAAALNFPLFRSGLPFPGEQRVSDWWLWDGGKSWRIGEITDEQRKLSILGIWNDTLLVERLESDWRPEIDIL